MRTQQYNYVQLQVLEVFNRPIKMSKYNMDHIMYFIRNSNLDPCCNN